MEIVSYAQNFEDVMLWRALKDVENGFYIDIGANEPEHLSVTKLFYDKGWNGINIEPVRDVYAMLAEFRPRDINLNIAISNRATEIELFVSNIYDKGLSTTSCAVVNESAYKDSFSKSTIIEAKTLEDVCQENNVETIHFLKVDVEGAEKDVLESFSFESIRPWICIVEATKPTTQIDVSSEWEYILLEKEYLFVYFDGLNKYYVAKEHKELMESFKYPPNVFDGFILANHRDAIVKASEAEAKASEAEAKASEAEAKASEAEAKASEAIHNYMIIMNSNSWKITKPLREVANFIRWFTTEVEHWITFSPMSRPRRILNQMLVSLKHRINASPRLKMKLMSILNKFPKLKARLTRVGQLEQYAEDNIVQIDGVEQLSPRAKKIYNDLKQAIESQQGNS